MRVELSVPENMKYVVQLLAKEESLDEKTALRRLAYEGMKGYVLSLYAKGRISLSKAAELLDLSVHDVLRLAKQHGLETGSSLEQGERSRGYCGELLK